MSTMTVTNIKVTYTFGGEEKTIDMGTTKVRFHNDLVYLGEEKSWTEHKSGSKSIVIGDQVNRWYFDDEVPIEGKEVLTLAELRQVERAKAKPQQAMSNSVKKKFEDINKLFAPLSERLNDLNYRLNNVTLKLEEIDKGQNNIVKILIDNIGIDKVRERLSELTEKEEGYKKVENLLLGLINEEED